MGIKDIYNNKQYREVLLDSLCINTGSESDVRDMLEYVIDNKLSMFDSEIFIVPLYEGEDKMSDLILPSIRRVWGKVFLEPPTILKDSKLELFKLLFNIDEFIDYLVDILPKCRTSLVHLEYLDRGVETLSLIVDNYISMLFDKAYNSTDIEQDIRDAKLRKLV